MNEYEKFGACGTCEGEEKCIQNFGGERKGGRPRRQRQRAGGNVGDQINCYGVLRTEANISSETLVSTNRYCVIFQKHLIFRGTKCLTVAIIPSQSSVPTVNLPNPYKRRILRPTNITFWPFYHQGHIKNFRISWHLIHSDLRQIRHTKTFIVLFNTVHPEDGRTRRPKHVGVVNNNVYNDKCICCFTSIKLP